MILLIQDRKSNLHLVDYTPPSGNKFTICGLVYRKGEILNTLALDAAIHNICRTCYEDYETMYGDDLENDIRMAHSRLNISLLRDCKEISQGHHIPEIKYWDMSHKTWDKLTRYQRKLLRK
jgi:hypothetical protein